jgi:hypothetical protein
MPLKIIAGKFIDTDDEEIIVVPKIAVDVADYLIKLVPFISPNGIVETEGDWRVVIKIFEAFIRCYPAEYQSFMEIAKKHKQANLHTKGDVEGTDFRHQMEIPERFHQLLRQFYPLQSYDTKFSRRLAREIPLLNAV